MLDGTVFLLFVPVCPADPAKIGRKVLEIILLYTPFHCPPQVTNPLLDLSATCITCDPKLGHRTNPPMNVWSKLCLLAVSWQVGYCLLKPILPHSITPTIIVPKRFLPSILPKKICVRAPWTQDAVYCEQCESVPNACPAEWLWGLEVFSMVEFP